jgi:sn-glycerol 3-phosphate transport system permease protein
MPLVPGRPPRSRTIDRPPGTKGSTPVSPSWSIPRSWRSSSPIGKIVISLLSAFAIVYFRFPFRMAFFWAIFVTLMLPIEVRILPTFKVAVTVTGIDDLGGRMLQWSLLDSYAGLTCR